MICFPYFVDPRDLVLYVQNATLHLADVVQILRHHVVLAVVVELVYTCLNLHDLLLDIFRPEFQFQLGLGTGGVHELFGIGLQGSDVKGVIVKKVESEI